jgi:hypothetical protein
LPFQKTNLSHLTHDNVISSCFSHFQLNSLYHDSDSIVMADEMMIVEIEEGVMTTIIMDPLLVQES